MYTRIPSDLYQLVHAFLGTETGITAALSRDLRQSAEASLLQAATAHVYTPTQRMQLLARRITGEHFFTLNSDVETTLENQINTFHAKYTLKHALLLRLLLLRNAHVQSTMATEASIRSYYQIKFEEIYNQLIILSQKDYLLRCVILLNVAHWYNNLNEINKISLSLTNTISHHITNNGNALSVFSLAEIIELFPNCQNTLTQETATQIQALANYTIAHELSRPYEKEYLAVKLFRQWINESTLAMYFKTNAIPLRFATTPSLASTVSPPLNLKEFTRIKRIAKFFSSFSQETKRFIFPTIVAPLPQNLLADYLALNETFGFYTEPLKHNHINHITSALVIHGHFHLFSDFSIHFEETTKDDEAEISVISSIQAELILLLNNIIKRYSALNPAILAMIGNAIRLYFTNAIIYHGKNENNDIIRTDLYPFYLNLLLSLETIFPKLALETIRAIKAINKEFIVDACLINPTLVKYIDVNDIDYLISNHKTETLHQIRNTLSPPQQAQMKQLIINRIQVLLEAIMLNIDEYQDEQEEEAFKYINDMTAEQAKILFENAKSCFTQINLHAYNVILFCNLHLELYNVLLQRILSEILDTDNDNNVSHEDVMEKTILPCLEILPGTVFERYISSCFTYIKEHSTFTEASWIMHSTLSALADRLHPKQRAELLMHLIAKNSDFASLEDFKASVNKLTKNFTYSKTRAKLIDQLFAEAQKHPNKLTYITIILTRLLIYNNTKHSHYFDIVFQWHEHTTCPFVKRESARLLACIIAKLDSQQLHTRNKVILNLFVTSNSINALSTTVLNKFSSDDILQFLHDEVKATPIPSRRSATITKLLVLNLAKLDTDQVSHFILNIFEHSGSPARPEAITALMLQLSTEEQARLSNAIKDHIATPKIKLSTHYKHRLSVSESDQRPVKQFKSYNSTPLNAVSIFQPANRTTQISCSSSSISSTVSASTYLP